MGLGDAGCVFPPLRQFGRDDVDEPSRGLPRPCAEEHGVRPAADEKRTLPRLEEIALVVHKDARDAGYVELLQKLLCRVEMELPRRVAGVDYLKEQIGVGGLLEGRAERGEEILG